jgi:hypothetical protein
MLLMQQLNLCSRAGAAVADAINTSKAHMRRRWRRQLAQKYVFLSHLLYFFVRDAV